MSRWHERHCTQPEVQVLGGLPYCSFCYAVASIDDTRVDTTPYEPRPATNERGDSFHLRWPSSVKYGHPYDLQQWHGSSQSLKPTVSSDPNESRRSEGGIAADKNISGRSEEISSRSKHHAVSEANLRDHLSRFEAPLCYPILLNSDDIRLLLLDPGDPDSLLHATFSTTRLDSKVTQYEALSYTWADENGNSDPCRPLFMGRFWDVVPITRNCENALRNIRPLEGGPRSIWVDSVCIDQTHERERSAQVALMSKIYSRASNTLAYLGSASQSSDAALNVITSSLMEWTCSHDLEEQVCEDCELAVHIFLSRPYFRRLWVVQEVILSKKVTIHCGSKSILWPHTGVTEKLALTAWAMHRERLSHRGSPQSPASKLISLLVDTSDCLCGDPRDKLFALLGLTTWNGLHEDSIMADYSLTLEEVCIGIAAYFITRNQGQKVLLLAGILQPRRIQSLPSWVPNISRLSPVAKDSFLFHRVFKRAPRANSSKALRFVAPKNSEMDFGKHTGSLRTWGTRICNLLSSFKASHEFPGNRILTPKKGFVQPGTQLKIHLPDLPEMIQENEKWLVDCFAGNDEVYWLHGVNFYVILRQDSATGFHQVLCPCDFVLDNESWGTAIYNDDFLYVDAIQADAETFLRKRLGKIVKLITRSVGKFYPKSFLDRKTAEVLLDFASWTNSQRAKYHAQRTLWQSWLQLEAMLTPMLTSGPGIMAIMKAFEKPDPSLNENFSGAFIFDGFEMPWEDEVATEKDVPQPMLRLLWSVLARREGKNLGTTHAEIGVVCETKLALAFRYWANVTEMLFKILGQSESLGDGLCQEITGSHLYNLWEQKWTAFADKVLPDRSNTMGSEETIRHLINLLPRSSEDSGGTDDPGVRMRHYTWAMLTEDLLWDWDEARQYLEKRWKFWECLENDKWMARWRSGMVEYGKDLESQLAIRLHLRPFDFNLEVHTKVTIV